ncbi:hypothetical protein D3C78_620360 [compost metagenome]
MLSEDETRLSLYDGMNRDCSGSVFNNQEGKNMRKAVGGAIAMAILLAGCGSKNDANEKNFGAAMSQYFNKKGSLCLNIRDWPVDLTEMDLRLQKPKQTSNANRMAVLEEAGLVKSEDTEADIKGLIGQPTGAKTRIKRFTLTDAAKPFVQERDVDSISFNGVTKIKQTNLCWGKKALDKIVKWDGPMKFGDYQEARITYTYKVNDTADWAKRPEVQAAFPFVKSILDGAGTEEAKHTVKLTSEGWEAKGLDN